MTAAAAALIVIAVLIFQFARSYNQLRLSIQQERSDYVSEISDQIITSQLFMKKEYANCVADYAGILSGYGPLRMAEARRLFSSRSAGDVLLVRKNGKIVDLEGNAIFFSDRRLLTALAEGDGTAQLFTSLNNRDDFWLFASPLEDVFIDGEEYETIVLTVSADEFRSSLAISLFDNLGASYIIQPDGSISIKPVGEGNAFSGYNLFVSLAQAGADEEELAQLEADMKAGRAASRLMPIGKAQWLLSYSKLDEGQELIVVTVPLTITAAQTYDGLGNTILCAALLVAAVAFAAIGCILYFFRRDRERQRAAMAVAAKSDFLMKMSHDIRTPLNAIIGMEMLAKDSADDPAAVSEYLSKSASAANYLLNLINDVLDMSRIESGKMLIANEPFDMDELIADVRAVITPTMAEKGLRFEIDTAGGVGCVYLGDQMRVKQILMNLLSNAGKFTKSGGSVWLSVARADFGEDRDLVTLRVRDTGIGISEDYLPHLFMPFEQELSSYTQQYAGSGLGLSIVHNLVTLMDGTIEVESKQGAGSCFTVMLPLARCEKRAVPERQTERLPSFAGRRLLIAEDNTVNQRVIAALLDTRFGIESALAGDGGEVVRMFLDAPAGTYDMILMDVKMPVLDGLAATRKLRALDRPDAQSIPIVALSANAYEEDVQLSLKAGMNAHLSKPIDIKALAAVLEKFIKNEEDRL